MTRHEVRLRGPFNPLPYSGLADSCERFFDYLIAVRQSAVFHNPDYIRDDPVAAQRLLGFRRDAVASILANLYVFAGALRADRKVPVSTLPSLFNIFLAPNHHLYQSRNPILIWTHSATYPAPPQQEESSSWKPPPWKMKWHSTAKTAMFDGTRSGATYTATLTTRVLRAVWPS